MSEALWLTLALWIVKIVGRAAFLTALVGFLAILLGIGAPNA